MTESDNWFVARGDEELGPFSVFELKEMGLAGKIEPTDEVRKEGMPNRIPVTRVKGLLPAADTLVSQSTETAAKTAEEDAEERRKAELKKKDPEVRKPALQIEAQARTSAPTLPAGEIPATPRPRLPMRMRRLLTDAEQMRRAFSRGSLMRLQATEGEFPELYRIEYHVHGLARGPDGQPVPRDTHLVEIQLTSEYPRVSPRCRVLTPIFHPNIDPSTICVGDHWAAGERLVDLVVRIGEMIAYQAYNIKSPLDGEAAMWADLNQQRLPLDGRDLRPPEDDGPVPLAGRDALDETTATAAPVHRPPAVPAKSTAPPQPSEDQTQVPVDRPGEGPPPPMEVPWKWGHWLAAAVVVLGLLAVAVGVVVGMVKARSERDVAERDKAERDASAARAGERQARQEADALRQDASAARAGERQARQEADALRQDASAARAGERQARRSEQLARQEADALRKQLRQVHAPDPSRTQDEKPLANAGDWTQFRGPKNSGIAESQAPGEWSSDKNLAWKEKIPGYGWSSPIIIGDKIIVTTAVSDKQKRPRPAVSARADPPDPVYRWEIHCLDRNTGKTVWSQVALERRPTIPANMGNGYASETPISDGTHVYAYFGMHGLFCYDLTGKQVWKKDLGSFKMMRGWGTGSSPALDGNRLFVLCDNDEKSFLAAYNKKTGEELWKMPRTESSNWSTPFVWRNKQRTEIVTISGKGVVSYDPANGSILWELKDTAGARGGGPPGAAAWEAWAGRRLLPMPRRSPTMKWSLSAAAP
jgi:ubiquitin-protein ligase